MPAKTLPPDFFAKYGTQINDAVRQTAAEPANPGIVRLPGGISNGIAQLHECYFGTGEKGDYWRASGKVVAPLHHGSNGSTIPLKGLQTSVVEMLGDDVGEAIKRIANHLKLLAGDKVLQGLPKEVLADPARMGAYLQTLSNKIADKKPYFRFSTELSKPTPAYPNSRVWERWHGTAGLEGYVPAGETASAVAVTDPKPWSEADKPVTPTPAPKAAAPVKTKETPKPVEPEPEPDTFSLDTDDVPALIDRANNQGDETARERLKQMAVERGHSEDDFENAGWDEIEAWFAEEPTGGTAGGDENVPVANETVVKYAPPDPKDKTKTKRLAAVQCEAIEVDADAKTMTLRSIPNKRHQWKGIAWTDPNVEWDS